MKAKRRVCALLFSALMIWQGFMIVNAEDTPVAAANGVEKVGTGNATATQGRGATDGKDTTPQEGNENRSGLTALEVPASDGSAPLDSEISVQTGAGGDTTTESDASRAVLAELCSHNIRGRPSMASSRMRTFTWMETIR